MRTRKMYVSPKFLLKTHLSWLLQVEAPGRSDNVSTKSKASSVLSTMGSIFQRSRINSPVKQSWSPKKTQTPSPGRSIWTFTTNFFVKNQNSCQDSAMDIDSIAPGEAVTSETQGIIRNSMSDTMGPPVSTGVDMPCRPNQ